MACVLAGFGITSLSAAATAIAAVGAELATVTIDDCNRAATAVLSTTDPQAARAAARSVLAGGYILVRPSTMFVNRFTSAAQQSDGQPLSPRTVPLLEPAQLFQAISGRFTSALPLVGWARELGDLHAELLRFQFDRVPRRGFDCEQVRALIDRFVTEIDAWAARNIPRTKNARKHTHSLGEVISHIAKTYAEAWWTVLHSADVELRHQAWFHLGEAREGYSEMVNEIRARHLQLPLGTSGIPSGRIR